MNSFTSGKSPLCSRRSVEPQHNPADFDRASDDEDSAFGARRETLRLVDMAVTGTLSTIDRFGVWPAT